jgi:hypothetical protein
MSSKGLQCVQRTHPKKIYKIGFRNDRLFMDATRLVFQTAVQETHLIHDPSSQDIAPQTAADNPIRIRNVLPPIRFTSQDEDSESVISVDTRKRKLPVIPDLRFEQAYLKQLDAAKGSVFWMVVITIREQILLPGVQGFLWALGMAGIRTLRVQQAESGRAWGTYLREALLGWSGRGQRGIRMK